MKIVTDIRSIEQGDIFLTKDMTAKLVAQPAGGCEGCVFDLDEDGCKFIWTCLPFSVFKKAVPTEKIERARDLLALKGELL